jgi:hypothetical protein
MPKRKLYKKRPKYYVTAVQLDLDFDGFEYLKWGGQQRCKPGDWLVNNNGDTYTIDKTYFRDFYNRVSPGVFNKIGGIWAEEASESGSVKTKEGSTDYAAGDYLVFDRPEGGDGYAIKKLIFERMYEEINPKLELTAEQQSYINERIQPKIEEFKTKAHKNERQYYFWQTFAIIAAALVPVFSGFISQDALYLKWLVALLGGTSAVIAGLLSLFKFQENWIRFRSTYQDLDSNVSQFKIGAGIYGDRRQAFGLLADNCESILKAEIGQWAETIKKETSEDDQ